MIVLRRNQAPTTFSIFRLRYLSSFSTRLMQLLALFYSRSVKSRAKSLRGVLKRFLHKYFSKRPFLLSNESSLRALLMISENDTLARGLKTIDFVIGEIPKPNFSKDYIKSLRCPTGCPLTRKHGHLERWMHDREWLTVFEKQERDKEAKLVIHLLNMVFSRFRSLGQRIEVRVIDEFAITWPKTVAANLEMLCGERLNYSAHPVEAVPTVLEAAAVSAIRLESFVVQYCNCGWSISTVARSPQTMLHTQEVFRHLRKLHLLLYKGVDPPDVVKTLCELLASANLVEDLALQKPAFLGLHTGLTKLHATGAGALCDCLSSNLPALKSLVLQGYYLTRKQLEVVVSHHPKLERLHFHGHEQFLAEVCAEFLIDGHEYEPVDGYIAASAFANAPHMAVFKEKMLTPCTIFELAKGMEAWDQKVGEASQGKRVVLRLDEGVNKDHRMLL